MLEVYVQYVYFLQHCLPGKGCSKPITFDLFLLQMQRPPASFSCPNLPTLLSS